MGLSFITELIGNGQVSKPEIISSDDFLNDSSEIMEVKPVTNKELQKMMF